uniref:Major facilitator superfamily (MFS) profile domain-containing protein n=1 Tax=Kryptolebias marmoratus TaxID=37003 RepID=A0A3Q2Z9I3_KRYMA
NISCLVLDFSSALPRMTIVVMIIGDGVFPFYLVKNDCNPVTGIEWVDIKHRTLVSVLLTMSWSFSTSLLPAVAYLVNDWRYLIATVTTPVLVAIISWWVPESARWLISNGKVNSAHFYLSKCAKFNGREEFMVLSKIIIVEDENRKYSFVDLIRTPNMRQLALLTGILWFGVACTYYGISFNIDGFGVNIYLTQFIYGIIEVPAKVFIILFVDKLGRRLTEAGTLSLTGLVIIYHFIPTLTVLLLSSVCHTVSLGKMFSEISFTTVYLYTAELYPTVMRQNGLGYCSFMARIGVAVSPLIMILEDTWSYLPGTLFTLLALSATLSTFFLPETANIRLPETIEDVYHLRQLHLQRCQN